MLALILLWTVIYLSGSLICKIGGEKETSHLWIHLTGFFFLIFLQGCVFLASQLLRWNFTKGRDLLPFLFLFISLLSLFICHKELRRSFDKIKKMKITQKSHLCLLLWLLIGLGWIVISQSKMPRTDAIVETVAITLETDTLNQYHPFTHEYLHSGIIFTRRLITLPFWYSAVSSWTGMQPEVTVRIAGTILCLLFSLMAFGYLGNLLFHENKNHTFLLLIMMEFLYLSGDYDSTMEAYRQLYYGYSGELIVAMAMLPAMIAILYRLTGSYFRDDFPQQQEAISMWTAIVYLGILFGASIFLTTITWGILLLFLSAALYLITVGIILWLKRDRKRPEEAV